MVYIRNATMNLEDNLQFTSQFTAKNISIISSSSDSSFPSHVQSSGGEGSDDACPFRNSSIYRSIFVYPSYGYVRGGWKGDILSAHGKQGLSKLWLWMDIDMDKRLKAERHGHYDVNDRQAQYSTEIIVREILTQNSNEESTI
jgi:hypothetical protein